MECTIICVRVFNHGNATINIMWYNVYIINFNGNTTLNLMQYNI